MQKRLSILILACIVLVTACTTGRKALEQGNYYDALTKAVNRLSTDPGNKKASQVLHEGYPLATTYYQEEIDRILTSNDPFKWKQTLDVMLTVNQLSEQIRRIPAARRIISSPKTYASELTEVQNKAAQEFYDAGMAALSQKTREAAKQAYFNFLNADDLVRGFKDSQQKMKLAKDLATLTVVVEQIPVNGKYEYSAQFFYDNVFQVLNQNFQEKDFVHFYSPEQAERIKLNYPDIVLRMGFYDFFIDRPQHFEEQRDLSKQVEESYEVRVRRDTVIYIPGQNGQANLVPVKVPKGEKVTLKRMVNKRGKIKIITDQVASGGLLEVKAVEFQSQKILFTDKVPGQYLWKNQYGIFVGDAEVLDNTMANIISNKAVLPPAAQDMFVLFTKPIYDQLSGKLINYFRKFN